MSSTILSYVSTNTSLYSPDGSITLNPQLTFQPGLRFKLRVIRFSISKMIPNIYSSGDIGTTAVFHISYDGGVNWTEVRLVNGSYSLTELTDAIQISVSGHFTAPGIFIYGNVSTGHSYFVLDETKLINPLETITLKLDPVISAGISIGKVSEFHSVLGFSAGATSTLTGSGSFVSDQNALVNYLGDECSIYLAGSLGRAYSILNGSLSPVIFTMSLGAQNLNGNVFSIQGNTLMPLIDIVPSSPITKIDLAFRSLSGRPTLILEGGIAVDLELMAYH